MRDFKARSVYTFKPNLSWQGKHNMTGPIAEILNHAHYICYEMEKFSKKFNQRKDNQSNYQEHINEINLIIHEIHEHSEKLYVYAEKFKYNLDYWIERDIQKTLKSLEQIITEIIQQKNIKTINPIALKNTHFKMYWCYLKWDDKYILHLEDWLIGLLPHGLYLDDDIIIYSDDNSNILKQILQNALIAERLFYNLENLSYQKQQKAIKLRTLFFINRTATPKPINLHKETGRIIITAYSAALKLALHGLNQSQLTSEKNIFKTLIWPRSGKGRSWNSETIHRGYVEFKKAPKKRPIKISYKLIPFPGQLGNIFTSGVGSYGTKKAKRTPNILTVINSLTNQEPEKEKKLANLFLSYKRGNGFALSEKSLRKLGFTLPTIPVETRKLINRINKIAYLVCFQEIYRRKNQGFYKKKDGSIVQTLKLPFGVAISSALMLIADGHLCMQDVFDSDSKYGVFTGTSIMTKNIEATLQKFNQLFILFFRCYMDNIFAFQKKGQKLNDVYELLDIEENIITNVPKEFYSKILKETDEKTLS